MKLEHLKQNARGHWHTIHRQLGIPQDYLNPHKHCPCPSCGGKDRYRYTNHKDNGGYICNQCGAGSGFAYACASLRLQPSRKRRCQRPRM